MKTDVWMTRKWALGRKLEMMMMPDTAMLGTEDPTMRGRLRSCGAILHRAVNTDASQCSVGYGTTFEQHASYITADGMR